MLPIRLDFQTLSLVMVLVTAFLTFVIIFVRVTQKTYSGFELWVFSNIAVAGGILLLGIDGDLTDILGTSLTFSAVLIGYEGNRRFLKLKHNLPLSLSIFILQIAALLYFKLLDNGNIVSQVSFTSLLVGGISIICGILFFKNSSQNTGFTYKFTGITYFIFALIMLSRSLITYAAGENSDFYKSEGIQPVFFILYILFEIVWTFNYINLNSDRLYKELEETKTELETLATTDFLTGINNNRNFFKIGNNEIRMAKRFRYSVCVIMFDIDFFKNINDDHGHSAGDKVLVEISETCLKMLRVTDTLGRLGGEEFGVLLPHTNIKDAKIVAESLREAIQQINLKLLTINVKVTASFGVTEIKSTDSQIKITLDRADSLLYEAKKRGRNRIVSDAAAKEFKELAIA